MLIAAVVAERHRGGRLRWRGAGALATLALALLVAATIAREPPDFARSPVIAIIRDRAQHPLWSIRLARAAHEIAAESLRPPSPHAGRAYQVWLAAPGGAPPFWIGLLPSRGSKTIPVMPWIARDLAGAGELVVTVEPRQGSYTREPKGPVVFHGALGGSG